MIPGDRHLPTLILQAIGVLLLVASAVFWALTGRESVLMVSSAMTLITLGVVRNAADSVKRRNGNGNGHPKES